MKCVDCEFYIEIETEDQGGCVQGGDTTDPDKDLNCAEAGDEVLEG